MSIRLKLHAVFFLTILVVLSIGIYAHHRYKSDLEEEQQIESRIVVAIELAHQATALFNAQVNSWKNILLRGNGKNDYHRYLAEYYRNERKTRNTIKKLNEIITDNYITVSSSKELITAHHDMGRKLRQALALYNDTAVNPVQVTDGFSEGIEEYPSNLLQETINQLIDFRHKQQAEFTKTQAEHQLQVAISTIVSICVFIGLFIWIVDSNIARPAEKATFLSKVISNAETATKFGIWDWNILGDEHFWSANLFKVLDLSSSVNPCMEYFVNAFDILDQKRIRNIINDAINTGEPFEFESTTKSQSVLQVKGYLTVSSNSATKRMTCVAHDVTDFQKMHDRFVRSDTMFRSVFNAAGDAILILKNGHFIDCNPQALVTFGCEREDILGKSPVDLSPAEQPGGQKSIELARHILKDLNQTNAPRFFSWKHKRLDGSTFDAEVTLTNVELEGEACVQGIVRDVTLRKRTEDAIRNVAASVSVQSGISFYQRLVASLSDLFDMQYVFIGLIDQDKPDRVYTQAACNNGSIIDNFSYPLANTPCANLLDGATCVYSRNIQQLFPEDTMLGEMGMESYIGSPLLSADGKVLGIIVALDSKPIQQTEWFGEILQIYAARIAAELERSQAEDSLFLKERAMECATESILLIDTQSNNSIIYANQAVEAISGYTRTELLGKNLQMFFGPDTDPRAIDQFNSAIEKLQRCQIEVIAYKKNGKQFRDLITLTPVNNDDGKITHFICTQIDVTERYRTEEQLRRTQKMEAIGQLAGGIAHDFNNQLGIIMGYLDLLDDSSEQKVIPQEYFDYITKATSRCADLTSQMLSFSRTRTQQTVLTNLNKELQKMDSLITGSITSHISAKLIYGENLWQVSIDPGEFQDVLINLVINARDAMPDGGHLVIETTNEIIDPESVSHFSIPLGEYVKLVVSDSGNGIPAKNIDRIFEPFFTTKPEGKGTGLGLAMTYAFVKRAKGEIKVISQPVGGTTFQIYLPRNISNTVTTSTEYDGSPKSLNNEKILIVDDDPQLLKLAETGLEKFGYTTFTANNSEVALDILNQQDIDLLFTDVVMPGNMDGYSLAEKALKNHPKLRILFTSGFTAKALAANDNSTIAPDLLQKPYRVNDLARRVRTILES